MLDEFAVRPTGVKLSVATEEVGPVSAHAVRCWTSMSRAFMSLRSTTMPPSATLSPRALWPPLRTENANRFVFDTKTALPGVGVLDVGVVSATLAMMLAMTSCATRNLPAGTGPTTAK